MNTTPQGERKRIVLVGRCNAGKSSLLNAIAGQPVAIVSEERGTTTDPVRKAMELLPVGPVLLCDTAGLDDTTTLGTARLVKTLAEIKCADVILLVRECGTNEIPKETEVLAEARRLCIPVIAVASKCDNKQHADCVNAINTSARNGTGIDALKAAIVKALQETGEERRIVADLVADGDVVLLVVPIDKAAPKGRLILPQQQVIRELLDAGSIPVVVRDSELKAALETLRKPPALVITDSQAFATVDAILPADVPLTSFSILFARYKGDLQTLTAGAQSVNTLKDGDRILIAEGCTHHRQDDDIGTVKIPRLMLKKTGKKLIFEHCSGMGYPEDLGKYALLVHCGACMLNRREMLSRISAAQAAGVPIVNYGVLLAALNGILDRCLQLNAKK